MTTIDQFDPFERRISEAIREIAEERRPEYLDEIFQATARSRQRPRWVFPERWLPVNRLTFAAIAIAIVALGGGVILVTSLQQSNVGPSIPPTASPPVATQLVGDVDLALQGDWLGAARSVPGISPGAGAWLSVHAGGLYVAQSNEHARPALTALASTTAAGQLRLEATRAEGSCVAGDVGLYDARLSASGQSMTIVASSEACSGRAGALTGRWQRVGCKSSVPCYGDVDPGTYGTEYFLPGMRSPSDWTAKYGGLHFNDDHRLVGRRGRAHARSVGTEL